MSRACRDTLVKVLSDMLEMFFENSGEVRSSVASQEMT